MLRLIATCLRALSETPIAAALPITGNATMVAQLAAIEGTPAPTA